MLKKLYSINYQNIIKLYNKINYIYIIKIL